jgi:t-SNARE complex subunit (syntaxin)
MLDGTRLEIDARLDELERKLDRLTDLVARMADDIEQVSAMRDILEAGLADAKAEAQRGFADLRNAVRHIGVRVGEAERYRLR